MFEKIKTVIIFLVAIVALSLVGLLSWDKYGPKKPLKYNIMPVITSGVKADIVIEGPTEVKTGQLVRLNVTKSTGKTFKWKIIPENTDFEAYDDGRKVTFSSGIAGNYTFIVACANDNDVDVKILSIKVEGETNPNTPVPQPTIPSSTLKNKVIDWVKLVNSPNKKAEASKLVISFSSVKSDILSGKLTTAEQIIEATRNTNRSALNSSLPLWVPFLEQLQKEMQARAEAGLLVTPEQHAQMWNEIVEGLTIISK